MNGKSQQALSGKTILGLVVFVVLLVGGVVGWRAFSGGTQGDDCASGMCSLGHLCVQRPQGPGRVCARRCESDAECGAERCVSITVRGSITGAPRQEIGGPSRVCSLP